MNRYDLSPLYRSTVGFDRLFRMLDTAAQLDNSNGYPPYNIERRDENAYRITVAVAGFSPDDLSVDVKESTLTVRGERKDESPTGEILHQGIAARAFERRFQLADHVIVQNATLANGLLSIDLVRELPENLKPRRIDITIADGTVPASLESKVAA
ncbi:MAG: Hsp20 family protein [Alphaproteobacteria bacterium]